MVGTKYPIIQAGMGPYSTSDLCIAVAKEGGLGLISTIGMAGGVSVATPESAKEIFGSGKTKEIIQNVIQHIYDNLKDYPDAKFGVNIPVASDFNFAAKKLVKGVIEICTKKPEIKEKLVMVVTSAGDPLPWAIDATSKGVKKAYIPIKEKLPHVTWCHVCPNVRGSQRAERAGVDIVIASGREGGAHCAWRDVSSMVLLPEVVKSVKTPVVAAGGFSDGVSLAAALTMGAIGVQMGTRFIATQESDFGQMWKEAIVRRAETDTLVARGLFGPMRFLRNPQSLKIVDETIAGASDLFRGVPCPSNTAIMKLELEGFGKLLEENEDDSILLGGVVTGRIHSIPTVKDLIESIMKEAEQIIANLSSKLLR
jgi:NAD(P)H-dependent flavin oxidoreductase YrpB (nitropropane dioxygenase family)